MKPNRWVLSALLAGAMVLSGCQLISPTLDETSPAASAAPALTESATLAPEQLPTAEPLWTPTAAPEGETPSSAAAAEETTADTTGGISDPAVAASVNGQQILRSDYEARLTQSQTYLLGQPQLDLQDESAQQDLAALQEQVLSWMVDETLIAQFATQAGIEVTAAQLQTELNRMRGSDQARFDEWLSANGMTLASLQEQLRTELLTAAVRDQVTNSISRRAPQVYIRHILLSDDVTAQKVLQELHGGANFIATARQYSEDQATSENGGELGWLPRGVLPPALEDVAFSLQAGEISDIIKADSGLHIIQVVEVDPDRAVSDDLWPVVQQRVFDDWLTQQRAGATIVYSADLVAS